MPRTKIRLYTGRAEKLETLLTDALKELKDLREHRCTFDSEQWCTVCGLDGRA